MAGPHTIVCEWCGNKAEVEYAGHGRPPRFCSDHCRAQSYKLRRETDQQQHAAARMRRYRERMKPNG